MMISGLLFWATLYVGYLMLTCIVVLHSRQ